MKITYLFIVFSLCAMTISCTKTKQTEVATIVPATIPLVIGTYTRKEGHVDGNASGIYLYELDTATGGLKFTASVDGIINPSYVAANGQNVLAASEVSPGEVVLFKYNSDSSELQATFVTQSYGDYPCHVNISPDNKYAFVANYGSGTIAAYQISNGELLFLDSATHSGSGLTSRQESAHAHMVTFDPVNPQLVYAVDLGTDMVYVYQLLENQLTLNYQVSLTPGSGPRQIVFHPNMTVAYVLSELNGSISLLKTNNRNEYELSEEYNMLDSISSQDAGAADIQVTPNGDFLYASIRGGMNLIVQYKIGDDGSLSKIGIASSGGQTPRAIKIDPTGKFLFSLNQDSDNITTYVIDENGNLDSLANTQVMTPVSMDFLR